MSQPVITINPSMQVGDASKLMPEKRIRRLPVMESDLLFGSDHNRHCAVLAKSKSLIDPLINAVARQEPVVSLQIAEPKNYLKDVYLLE